MAVNRLSFLLGTELTGFRYSGHVERERTTFQAEIPSTLYGALADFSDTTGISLPEVAEEAFRRYLRAHYWNEEGN